MSSFATGEAVRRTSHEGHCARCVFQRDAFCHLPANTLHTFYQISNESVCREGDTLFVEGQSAAGVYLLCEGRVKFLIGSHKGKSLMRIALPGDILGLNAAISGAPYEGTAEMLSDGVVRFVARDAFLRFLHEHGPASFRAAEFINRDYFAVHQQMLSVALSSSVGEKLAKLLLNLCDRDGEPTGQGIRINISLTHEEIAQMIGTSRETVTRLLGDLKGRNIVTGNGSGFLIHNRAALEELIDS